MKHPATRVAAVGLAAAAALSGALYLAAPADAQPVASSGTSTAKSVTATNHAKTEVSTTANGTTFDWGYQKGWLILNLNNMPVYAGQPVTVSPVEVDSWGNEFIGGAHMHCENVAVTQNRVSALCQVDWGSPLHIRVHYVY